MAGYAYGNARLRAMKSRLLSDRDLESLAEAGNLKALIAELAETAYRPAVESALARFSGIECVSVALRDDLESTLKRIRGFYDGPAGETVSLVLRAYDVQNLKAVLRGLAGHATPGEIMFTILPVGDLSDAVLAALAREADPRSAVDLLATLALPFAQPLLELRAEQPGAGTMEMELRLDQWHYRQALRQLQQRRLRSSTLFAALQLEADLVNLQTVIRLVSAPEERGFLHQWLGVDDPTRLFVGPGKLPFDLLLGAANKETMPEAVESFAATSYGLPLQAGSEAYAATGRLSAIEKQLRRHRLSWSAALIGKDPLGIGVLLGYLALKANEVSNIRWIAQGVHIGLARDRVEGEMVRV